MADRTDIGTLNGLVGATWPTHHITRLIFERLATISPIDGAPATTVGGLLGDRRRRPDLFLSSEPRSEMARRRGLDRERRGVQLRRRAERRARQRWIVSSNDQVESYRATDDDTFEITVKEPIVTFLWDVPAAISIMPRHIWEGTPLSEWRDDPGSTGADPGRVVGTGPFKFELREEGKSVRLVRNDQHYSCGSRTSTRSSIGSKRTAHWTMCSNPAKWMPRRAFDTEDVSGSN